MQHQIHPLSVQGTGDGGADAMGRAGDEGALAGQ
jgi:hypothetical protein